MRKILKEIDALGRNWGNRWCSDIDGTFMHRILNQSPPLHPHWSPCPFMQILSKLWRIKNVLLHVWANNLRHEVERKIFWNWHVPSLYLTGSVYLFGFLFLHQAVETSQPCKTVQFSSSRSERFCIMDWQKEKNTKLAKDLDIYIYDQYASCIEVLIFDIREHLMKKRMFSFGQLVHLFRPS